MTHRVLVTGATGFVGQAVVSALQQAGESVRKAVRELTPGPPDQVAVGDVGDLPDWSAALDGIDAVIHLAARVHVMHETAEDALAANRRINTAATAHLAESAARLGVRRFVYVSSIKVNGEGAEPSRAPVYTEASAPAPLDAYGISKWEAEQRLWEISARTGMEMAIIRPPLVYGAGVKANFLRLIRLADRGIPLPLGRVDNRRSMIYVENLADFIATCAAHPQAANQLFLIDDQEAVSTKSLVTMLARLLGKSAMLIPVPVAWMRLAAQLTGREATISRLVDSLVIDSSKASRLLGWKPPFAFEAGIRRTVTWYRSDAGHSTDDRGVRQKG